MKNPAVSYAIIALGIILALAGVYMHWGMHFKGKAYAAVAVGAVLLIIGIVNMVISKPAAATR